MKQKIFETNKLQKQFLKEIDKEGFSIGLYLHKYVEWLENKIKKSNKENKKLKELSNIIYDLYYKIYPLDTATDGDPLWMLKEIINHQDMQKLYKRSKEIKNFDPLK